MDKIIDCSLWPILAGCHTEAISKAIVDHHYLVGTVVSLTGFIISLSVIRYFDGPMALHFLSGRAR